MRQLLLVIVVAAAGCAAQGLPIEGGNGPGNGPGSGPGTGPGGGPGGGPGVPTADLALNGVGGGCQTACDCMPGLACLMGTCQKTQFGPLYCCDDTNECPAGSFCQSSQGGFSQCGMGGSGGTGGGFPPPPFFGDMATFPPFDGGFGSGCSQISCMSDNECIKQGCMTCSRRGHCR